MTTILTHGDGDGVCCASLIKMISKYKKSYVIFTHPMGLVNDMDKIDDDIIICDIAIDRRMYSELCELLEKKIKIGYHIIYLDHHQKPGDLPEDVVFVHQEGVSATELVFRYFYYDLPHNASHLALIGAINDYLETTQLMKEIAHQYEKRTLYLDAGLLAQGLKDFSRDYNEMRRLVDSLGNGKFPCEIKTLVNKALSVTRQDKYAQEKVLEKYSLGKTIAWVLNPSASRSKAAHWIMGDSGKVIGITIIEHRSRKDLIDMTIRGRNKVDLRQIVPKLAKTMGGSGGGHANACGCRIPKKKMDIFLKILDSTINALNVSNGPKIGDLIQLDEFIQ